MKPDELALLRLVYAGETPKDAHAKIGMHPKRMEYLAQKWCDRGYRECGVSARTGWWTDKGRAWAAEILARL